MYKSKLCIKCSKQFIPNSPKQIFCKECLVRTCQRCGEKFTVTNPHYFPKFCSNVCYFSNRWGKGRNIETTCLECGKTFHDYLARRRKFCNKKCYRKWGKTHETKSHHWKGGRIKYGSHNRYWAIYQPLHPFSDSKGYVMEHRLVIEKSIKRFIKPHEIIHHLNFNPSDNRLENLQLLTKKEHDKLHTTERHKTQPQFGR